MKPLYKRGITVFTAPCDTELSIFNYPEKIKVKKGDQVIFKIRYPKPSKIISHTHANRSFLNFRSNFDSYRGYIVELQRL